MEARASCPYNFFTACCASPVNFSWSLMTAGSLVSIASRVVQPNASAVTATSFSTRSGICAKTSGAKVRTVPVILTSLQIILNCLPASTEPIVTTSGASGLFSRLTSVCRFIIMALAATIASFP